MGRRPKTLGAARVRLCRNVVNTWWTGAVVALLPGVASADQATDRKQECLAASDQGQNERDEGRYRGARQAFTTCARDGCPRVVLEACTKWLAELDELAPTIVLEVKDEQGTSMTDVKVTFDGAPFATVLDGRPLEADAGKHLLHFERDGSEPVEQELVLRAGQRARVVTVTLRSVTAPAPADTAPGAGSASLPPEPATSARFVTAAAIGLGAVAAAGTGVYFLIQSNQRGDEAAGLRNGLPIPGAANGCTDTPSSMSCQLLGDKVRSQHNDMTVASTLLVGAGVVAAGAVASWFLWPRSHDQGAQTTAWVAPTQGGAALQVATSFR